MKKIILAIALLIALLPFSTHAGFFGKEEWEKEDCPKNHSLAWCLADYQGRSKGIHDMSQEDFVAALKKAGVTDESQLADILHSGLGVSTGIGLAAMGNLFGGGVFMLHALMPDQIEQNKRDPYVVFFDENTGRSTQQMANDFNAVVLESMKAAIPTLPNEIVVTEINKEINNRHIKYYRLSLSNTECKDDAKCSIGSANTDFYMSDKIRKLPQYLDAVPVVSSGVGKLVNIGFQPPIGVNRAILAKAISEKLPDWMYWYIPAGYLGGNPFSLFLNQGKALFFVKPKEGDPTPVMPHVAARFEAEKKTMNATTLIPESASGVMETSTLAN